MKRVASIGDLRARARRRLPRFAFDFIDGGAESETGLRRNREAFGDIELLPRYLVDVSEITVETELYGKSYAVPFGMAPLGFLNMAWPGADLMMARLAASKRMAYAVSSASSTALEEIAEAAGGYAWFQIYMSDDEALSEMLLRRAGAVGCEVLVVTVDVAQPGKRDRDIRNGLQIPFRPTLRMLADLALHPRWSLGSLRHGAPGFANFTADRLGGGGSISLPELQSRLISNRFDWDDLRRLRDRWSGRLVVKGILHPEDAARVVAAGCDGIVVSNHGGRQADFAPPTISVLPGIAAAVGGRVPVMLDGGVRRGADIVRAKALGADFVFVGRPFAYGAGAGGEAGCRRAFEILETELSRTLGQIGRGSFGNVDGGVLWDRSGIPAGGA